MTRRLLRVAAMSGLTLEFARAYPYGAGEDVRRLADAFEVLLNR